MRFFKAKFCPEGWRSHPGNTVVDETLEKMLFGQADIQKTVFWEMIGPQKNVEDKCWGRNRIMFAGLHA